MEKERRKMRKMEKKIRKKNTKCKGERTEKAEVLFFHIYETTETFSGSNKWKFLPGKDKNHAGKKSRKVCSLSLQNAIFDFLFFFSPKLHSL